MLHLMWEGNVESLLIPFTFAIIIICAHHFLLLHQVAMKKKMSIEHIRRVFLRFTLTISTITYACAPIKHYLQHCN